MDNEQNTGQAQTIIVKSTKNVALATGLAFFFGPIGMCYATILSTLWSGVSRSDSVCF